MFMGNFSEWTISPRIDGGTKNAYDMHSMGHVEYLSVLNPFYIRPVFYLNSDVAYSSGSGIESDPIRIN